MKLTRLVDGRWLLEIDGCAFAIRDHELDELADAVSFRIRVEEVVPIGSGVGLRLSSDSETPPVIHLCYSDEAEEVARRVVECSGIDYETGRHRPRPGVDG